MLLPKLITVAILASTATFSAFAADCYTHLKKGEAADINAGAVFFTFESDTNTGIAVYVKPRDHAKERNWLAPGEKVTRMLSLRRSNDCKGSESQKECRTLVHNEIELSYSPSASEVELLHFTISNKDKYDDQKYTHYNPHSRARNNVSCKLTWRPNLQRWDLDLKFK